MNNILSDFVKFAYEHQKVLELEDAFNEYDTKDEYHKGNPDLLFEDSKINYNYYDIGDIVFVSKYEYGNNKPGNNHLFVIIDKNNLAVPIENFGMLISSNIDKLKYKSNKLLKKDNKNNLAVDSIVKTDAIYKLPNKDILFKIGTVDIENVNQYKNSFFKKYKNDSGV